MLEFLHLEQATRGSPRTYSRFDFNTLDFLGTRNVFGYQLGG